MDMSRFELANSFHEEYIAIMLEYLIPKDISVTHGEPDFDNRSYARSPEEAAGTHCESIFIAGDNSIKKHWLKVLPSISGVRRVFLHTTAISETLMQAVCCHTGIERLNFSSTRLESFDSIAKLSQLTHLAIGSSPRVSSLYPVSGLRNLVSLCIQGNLPKISHLEELSPLHSLKGLILCGQDYKDLHLDSLEPISQLKELSFFGLAATRVSSGGLRALCELPNLEFLHLDAFHMNVWQLSDIAALNEAHPKLKGSLIRRVATEPEVAKRLKVG